MSQQRKGGLGRGLAALIPTGADEGPRLGDGAADVILGPRTTAPRAKPPRPGQSAEKDDAAKDEAPVSRGRDSKPETGPTDGAKGKTKDGSKKKSKEAGAREDQPASEELVDGGAVYREISPDQIVANPKQPRTVFDEEALAELTHSVKEFGLLQPIVVREMGPGEYQLIMGERRLRASRNAGLDTIPAIVRQTEDEDLLRDALLENIHRVQLNPLEEAAAYQQLLDEFGVSQVQLATRIGRSRPAITNSIRLLQLPTAVQRRVAAGVLSAGHARAVLGLTTGPEAQESLAARIVAEGLSVRATEEYVTIANKSGQSPDTTKTRARPEPPDPELQSISGRLSDRLETSVNVTMGKRKGRITIDVGDAEDLQRIVAILEGR